MKGEFLRISAEAVACLRTGSDDALRLADDLERIRGGAAQDLSGAAETLLSRWDGFDAKPVLGREQQARFDDASERLAAIARIVLGR